MSLWSNRDFKLKKNIVYYRTDEKIIANELYKIVVAELVKLSMLISQSAYLEQEAAFLSGKHETSCGNKNKLKDTGK